MSQRADSSGISSADEPLEVGIPSEFQEDDKEQEIRWEWALQMASFTPEDGTEEEQRLKDLMQFFREQLEEKTGIPSSNNCAFVTRLRAKEKSKEPDAFIKIGVTLSQLRVFAEKEKIQLPTKHDYFLKTGVQFLPYTRANQKTNVYAHPSSLRDDYCTGQLIVNTADEETDHKCRCNLFLPAQESFLMEKVVSAILDLRYNRPGGFGLKEGKKKGEILDAFPLHVPIRARKAFLKGTFGWAGMLTSTLQCTRKSKRFINYVRGYFGEKVGLYFSFLHFYTTALCFLAVPGLFVGIYQYRNGIDSILVPIYSVYTAIWGVLFLQYWKRKQAAAAHRWGMSDYVDEEEPIAYDDSAEAISAATVEIGYYNNQDWISLVDYRNYKASSMETEVAAQISEALPNLPEEEKKALLETMIKEDTLDQTVPSSTKVKQHWATQFLKTIFSTTFLATLACGVVAVTISLLFFRIFITRIDAFWGGIAAGCVNAVSIMILDYFYNFLAIRLNNWERHRTPTQYENSLIIKTFFFQFVNAYCSLFYIAFFKGKVSFFGLTDACQEKNGNPTDSCMFELATQVQSILITRIFLGNCQEVLVPWILGRFNLWRNTGSYELKGEDSVVQESILPTYNGDRVSGTFADYAELAIQYGYVVLFAPAFPLAAVVALGSNVLENTTDTIKMLSTIRKPVYRGARDIGPWFDVFSFLSMTAVVTNSLILGFTSDQLNEYFGDSSFHKWLVVLSIEHIVLCLQFFIANIVQDTPTWVRTEDEMRHSILGYDKIISENRHQAVIQAIARKRQKGSSKKAKKAESKRKNSDEEVVEIHQGQTSPEKAPSAGTSSELLNKLKLIQGKELVVINSASQLAMRSFWDENQKSVGLDAKGAADSKEAEWKIMIESGRPTFLRFYRANLDPARPSRKFFLRIDKHGDLSARGGAGKWSLFEVKKATSPSGEIEGCFSLQSAELANHFVAFKDDGSICAADSEAISAPLMSAFRVHGVE
eukprot:gb/GEZN01001270.1/.p1 GENE.gb/GEZN01001270.1/~~gb/GEZN01001270.1/.p1  ORF type:complete len:993 (+),score=101.68 gb/GEZN01001270.1/:25-3003(+)